MKIYLISQTQNTDYDTFDSAVVAADTEQEAKKIHPSGEEWEPETWCNSPNEVEVELVGEDIVGKSRVILASFNAA